jgi:hypothetical protein
MIPIRARPFCTLACSPPRPLRPLNSDLSNLLPIAGVGAEAGASLADLRQALSIEFCNALILRLAWPQPPLGIDSRQGPCCLQMQIQHVAQFVEVGKTVTR